MKQSIAAEPERQPSNKSQHQSTSTFPLSQAFVDNRESAKQLRQLKAAMNNSPQAIGQRKLSEKLNNSPRMIAQRQQMAKITGAAVQRVEGEEELLQGKFKPVQRVEEDELLQGKFSTAQLEESPAEKQNNTGLPDNLKYGIEHLSGMSMDHVKVHYNSSQPAQLNALAYAQGTDIHVAPGQEQHLPHEAWHVVQQAQGRVKPTMRMAGQQVNDDQGLEREADVMGEKASSVGVVQAKRELDDSIVLDPADIQNNPLTSNAVQKRSAKQEWDMPGNIKNHIFDGEEKGNNLSGLHSEARKNESNEKLRYTDETKGYRKSSQSYGAKVKAKFGDNWSPRNDAYKYSDMFPTSWSEDTVIEAIEAAYDTTYKYTTKGETIRRNDQWKVGKWLGNAKGMTIVFAGNPLETIYPKR